MQGLDAEDSASSKIFFYDPDTNTWSEKQVKGESPGALWGHKAVAVGDKIYLIGGFMGDPADPEFNEQLWIAVGAWLRVKDRSPRAPSGAHATR